MLKFRLNCIPTAQARARHGRTKSGLHVTFKSSSQKANERTLDAPLAGLYLTPSSAAAQLAWLPVSCAGSG